MPSDDELEVAIANAVAKVSDALAEAGADVIAILSTDAGLLLENSPGTSRLLIALAAATRVDVVWSAVHRARNAHLLASALAEPDSPSPREHEKSGTHELVAIDGVPTETYPFLPTKEHVGEYYSDGEPEPDKDCPCELCRDYEANA